MFGNHVAHLYTAGVWDTPTPTVFFHLSTPMLQFGFYEGQQ